MSVFVCQGIKFILAYKISIADLIYSSGSISPYGFYDDLLKNLAEHFANHIDDSFVILFFIIDDDN